VSPEELKQRIKAMSLRALKLGDALPRMRSADVIARQLIRSATSAAANYRAACLGRSKAEFLAKLAVTREEADETAFWLELVCESGLLPESRVADLITEAREITAILVASRKTAEQNARKQINRQ
jgi:four helix bundle protein